MIFDVDLSQKLARRLNQRNPDPEIRDEIIRQWTQATTVDDLPDWIRRFISTGRSPDPR